MTDPQILISRYFAGTFSPQDIAEMREWILSDSANALEYARATLIHNSLRQILSGAGRLQDLRDLGQMRANDTMVGIRFEDREVCDDCGPSLVADLPTESEVTVQGQESEAIRQDAAPEIAQTAPKSRRFYWGRAAAIVLPILLAVGAWSVFHSRAASATFAAAVDSQWDSPSAHPVLGAQLPADTLNLMAGLAKLRFASGADVIVEGPARFRIRSDNALDLDAGRLTAVVPPGAHGFSVHTPSAIAVDLGTEFGVAVVDDTTTRIEVFRGKVEARPLHAINEGATQIVTAEHVCHVTADTAVVDPASPEPSEFVRQEEFDARALVATGSPYHRWLAYSYQLRRDADLVAYYTFDNAADSPDRLLNCSSRGAALDGILGEDDPQAKPTWTSGRWPETGALAFGAANYAHAIVHSGVGDALDFSHGDKIASPFTIATWIRVDVHPDEFVSVVAKGFVGAEQFGIDLSPTLNQRAWVRRTPATASFPGCEVHGADLVLGSWGQLVLTYDPAIHSIRLYVNGRLSGQRNDAPDRILETDQPVTIGARRDSKSADGTITYLEPFEGRMGELAILRRALSAEQVQEMYRAGTPD